MASVSEPVLRERGIASLVGQLTTDARELASAEIALQKAKVGEVTTRYKGAAVFFVAAGVLGLSGLIALLVGLILSLATLIGPGLSTLIVVGIVFAAAAVLGTMGRSRLAPPGAA